MFTIEETDTEPSLTLPSTAMCEWQSMMPGVTNWPVASITTASAGAFRVPPTAAIFPSLIKMSPLSMVPWETVRIVALRIRITGAAASNEAPLAGFSLALRSPAAANRNAAARHKMFARAFIAHPQPAEMPFVWAWCR